MSAAAVAWCAAREQRGGAGTLCERSGIRWLQSESRSVGRPLDIPAAHGQTLVSVVRENGGARCAGDGARQFIVQSKLPYDRGALSVCRYDGVHAVHPGGSVQGLSDAE